jgi:hypothetical protein
MTAAAAFGQVLEPSIPLEKDLLKMQLRRKLEEIRQRMKYNEELFMVIIR